MEVGDHHNVERGQRTPLDAALDALNEALTDLIATVDNGALEQLKAEEKWRCGNASKRSATNCLWWITA
jgi:hypothetical protein